MNDRNEKKTADAGEILDRVIGDDAEVRHLVGEEKLNVRIAEMIHDARTPAGFTQADLPKLVGTTQSVIE